jgi:YfiH family protein
MTGKQLFMRESRFATPRWITPEWPAPPNVRALSTCRGGGASRPPFASLNLGGHVEDNPLAVARNRRSLRESAGLPNEPRWLAQVHGTQVVDLDTAEPAALPTADAAISRAPGRVCAILTADCLPVLLTTESGHCVGAAHAGWRGLAAGVIESTITAMAVSPHEIMAWLGPAIGPAHFEVGPEVQAQFVFGDPGAATAFVASDGGRFRADLYALARHRLARMGVERVYGGGECTFRQADKYFSHRRDGRTGRQATLIWLESLTRR